MEDDDPIEQRTSERPGAQPGRPGREGTSHLVRWTAAALLGGVVLGRTVAPSTGIAVVAALASAVAVALRTVPSSDPNLRRSRRLAAACAVAGALVGFVRGVPAPAPPAVPDLEVASVEGTVVRAARLLGPPAADEGPGEAEAALSLDLGGAEAIVLVPLGARPSGTSLGGLERLLPGDRVRVVGSVRPREPRLNPGARTRPPGAPPLGEVVCPGVAGVSLIESPSGLRWAAARVGERVHRAAVRRLGVACGDDPETAGLLACLLVGERSGVEPETSRDFRDSGTAHLLAVSGLHLVLLAGGLAALGRAVLPVRLRTTVGAPLLAAAVVVYAAACRFEVPVVRSALFLGVSGVARLAGRRGAPLDALALAAALVVVLDPGQVFDAGFQLSFVAVAGLTLLTRRFREALFARLDLLARFPEAVSPARLRASTWTAEAFSASLAASIATAPVVAWHFGTAQPAAPLANLAAVPVFGALLPFTVLLAVVGPWAPAVAAPFAAAGAFAFETTAWAFSGVPVVCGRPPLPLVVASAVLLVAGAAIRPWRPVHLLIPAAAWCAVALVPGWIRPSPQPEVIALDVGHGTAVLVRSGDAAMLYDAGGRAPATGERILVPALRTLGVRRLDALWISHEDADHVDGAFEVLRDVAVDEVLVAEGFGASPLAARLLAACAADSVPVRAVRRGDRWARRGLAAEVLDPAGPAPYGAENADSLVLHVVASSDAPGETVSALLPGDVESGGLVTLAADPTLPAADVLLLPHHGRGDPAHHAALARRAAASVLVASTSESLPTEVAGAWVTGRSGAVRVRGGGRPEPWPW